MRLNWVEVTLKQLLSLAGTRVCALPLFCWGIFAAAWRTSLTCLSSSPPTLLHTSCLREREREWGKGGREASWGTLVLVYTTFTQPFWFLSFICFRRFLFFYRLMKLFENTNQRLLLCSWSWTDSDEILYLNYLLLHGNLLTPSFKKRTWVRNFKLIANTAASQEALGHKGRGSSANRREKFSAWNAGFMWTETRRSHDKFHLNSVMCMWRFPRSELISFGQGETLMDFLCGTR